MNIVREYKQMEDTNMCVGLSARVVRVSEGSALVDASGARREVSAQLVADLEPGDYVMVHAGAAIAKITEDDTKQADDLMEEFLA
jgi:hydrogenase expression/formation protein HypC